MTFPRKIKLRFVQTVSALTVVPDPLLQLRVLEIRTGQALVLLNITSLLYGSCYLIERLIGVVLASVTTAGTPFYAVSLQSVIIACKISYG
jgi:hypothetical protein